MSDSRYHRQELLPDFGPDSSSRLARGHAMIVGIGALGTVAADLLARAGVGRLTLVDRDIVEATNLQRQTLFDEADARAHRPKADAAAGRLSRVNSAITIESVVEDFAASAAARLAAAHPRPDVLLDCTDNFSTRFTANDVAVKLGIPLCYAGAVATRATVFTVLPGHGPCLRCLFPEPPAPGSSPTCDTVGVLGPCTAVAAAHQATDALKVLLGRMDLIPRRLTAFDVWTGERRLVDASTARDPACPCCGRGLFEHLESGPPATVLCGRNTVQVAGPGRVPDLAALAARLAPSLPCARGVSTVRFRVPGTGQTGEIEVTVFADGRALVGGTSDPVAARAVYDRYVGA